MERVDQDRPQGVRTDSVKGGVKCLGVGARDPGPRVRGKGVEGWEPCEVADKFRLP